MGSPKEKLNILKFKEKLVAVGKALNRKSVV